MPLEPYDFSSPSCSSLQRRHCLVFFSPTYVSSFLVLALDRSTSASLPAQSFFDALKPKNKENDVRNKQAKRGLARQRLLILAYGEMETVVIVRMYPSYVTHISLKTLENSSLIVMQCVWRLLNTSNNDWRLTGTRCRCPRLDKATRGSLQFTRSSRVCFTSCCSKFAKSFSYDLRYLRVFEATGSWSLHLCRFRFLFKPRRFIEYTFIAYRRRLVSNCSHGCTRASRRDRQWPSSESTSRWATVSKV